MKFAAWLGIVVGILMATMWTFFRISGQVPELQTEPYEIAFHLAAEFGAAGLLVAGGIGLLKRSPHGQTVYYLAIGMLLYSVIVSPGYYAQQGSWGFVAMFGAILAVAVVAVTRIARVALSTPPRT